MQCVYHLITAVFLILTFVEAVDRSNFKTCEQSSFCRRCRKTAPGRSNFEIAPETVQVYETSVKADLIDASTSVKYKLELTALADATYRLTVDEEKPIKERFKVPFVLLPVTTEPLEVLEKTSEKIIVKSGENKVIVHYAPFKLDCFSHDELVISANSQGLMKFEHQRRKSDPNPARPEGENLEGEAGDDNKLNEVQEDPGAWEENFKSHHDSKPYGPTAVALDFTFVNAHHAYGLPEHAETLALKSTKKGDPYRLYNFDVFEYEIHSTMALYAAMPFAVGLGKKASGIFWLNAAETWVDVAYTPDSEANNVMSSIVNFVSGSQTDEKTKKVDLHFMSESGIIDVFFHLGPSPHDVFRQYTKLTGTSFLPPYFSLAYHQCRWNYNDENDVFNVAENFDKYDIPMDVMWLDIEYTDGKKYFTWDEHKFPHALEMVYNLTTKGRKLVVIIDPHIKRDSNYFLHNDAENNGYYVKNKDRKDYEGWCWPGSSSYLDFLDPKVREYYASQYSTFQGTNTDVYIWNDMNEPSVFNGPEVTMPKDCIHYGDVEHRELHNIYGFMQTLATYDGLLARGKGMKRPFILTRSAFSGSQRYAAIWTGDNAADWTHLQISYPMCLSLAISGMSFCGADVGGFFGNPNPELLVRWYQTGVFLPFFRGHAHIDTKRREPWLFDDQTVELIRQAIRLRYSLLPLIYTTFYEHTITGLPVIRPLWSEFPQDVNTYDVDNQLILGSSLMVRPVQEAGVSSVNVLFPGHNELWYDLRSYQAYKPGSIEMPVDISTIPLFQRGGSILPLRERARRSSVLTLHDPLTLLVALNSNGTATGTLYLDDGDSFEYQKGQRLYMKFEFKDNVLSSSFLSDTSYDTSSWIERVLIIGASSGPKHATVKSASVNGNVEVMYNSGTQVLMIRKPAVKVTEEWSIILH
ncbi:unnamed protein product [Bemisia tabaci]|uniref:Glucosidase II subunit alpha n=1 Tax=Bemisia tabaci TaxID=7038 RepID=A0A9N9ZWV3_BEMTA|nr:unnamed protein product [Bemisia tabaci]